jgi:hypothetical protein
MQSGQAGKTGTISHPLDSENRLQKRLVFGLPQTSVKVNQGESSLSSFCGMVRVAGVEPTTFSFGG